METVKVNDDALTLVLTQYERMSKMDEDVPFVSFLRRCILDDIPFLTSPLESDLPELLRW